MYHCVPNGLEPKTRSTTTLWLWLWLRLGLRRCSNGARTLVPYIVEVVEGCEGSKGELLLRGAILRPENVLELRLGLGLEPWGWGLLGSGSLILGLRRYDCHVIGWGLGGKLILG